MTGQIQLISSSHCYSSSILTAIDCHLSFVSCTFCCMQNTTIFHSLIVSACGNDNNNKKQHNKQQKTNKLNLLTNLNLIYLLKMCLLMRINGRWSIFVCRSADRTSSAAHVPVYWVWPSLGSYRCRYAEFGHVPWSPTSRCVCHCRCMVPSRCYIRRCGRDVWWMHMRFLCEGHRFWWARRIVTCWPDCGNRIRPACTDGQRLAAGRPGRGSRRVSGHWRDEWWRY